MEHNFTWKNDGRTKVMIGCGTRPEIIRLAAVIKRCREYFDCCVVYYNQNWDRNLSTVFWEDFELKNTFGEYGPDILVPVVGENLGVTCGNIMGRSYELLSELQPEGSPPWFSLFSPAAEKNIDGGTGLGMAVFAEALDTAQGVDLAFDNYRQDLYLGGKKIFYDRSLCKVVIGADGQPHYIPPDDMSAQQFFSLPGKEASLDAAPEWHEYNPDLRTEDNHRAVQDMLDLFSFKCGLGCHRYSFELGKVATATEYTGSRQDLVQSANKNQIPIETALIGILRAILWAAKNLLGAPVDPETSISVNWDDSYIVSEQERTNQLREDAIAGLVPRCRYLAARYGLSEKEAHRSEERRVGKECRSRWSPYH